MNGRNTNMDDNNKIMQIKCELLFLLPPANEVAGR